MGVKPNKDSGLCYISEIVRSVKVGIYWDNPFKIKVKLLHFMPSTTKKEAQYLVGSLGSASSVFHTHEYFFGHFLALIEALKQVQDGVTPVLPPGPF